MKPRSVGVEEELLLVEPGTGRPSAVSASALRMAEHGAATEPEVLEFELQQQQLETNTEPRRELDDLHREIRRCRVAAADAARSAGVRIAALGTSPVVAAPELVDKPRYQKMAGEYGLTMQELLTCGCHVHVQIASDDEGIAVLDRVQPWLPPLLALSANSPFWQGLDSSYASYRYQVWGRLPSAGPTGCFGTARAYQDTVQRMVRTGALVDTGMVYFDARLSQRYPTIEFRVADVCLRAEDAVLIAALARALVETEARAARRGEPATGREPASCPRPELLRLASWRASRSGLDDVLVSPVTWLPEKPSVVTALLVEHVRDALEDAGDCDAVGDLLGAVLRRGNGAAFQREAYRRSGDLSEVVREAVSITER